MQFYHPPFWSQAVGGIFFLVSFAAVGLGAWLLWSLVRGR